MSVSSVADVSSNLRGFVARERLPVSLFLVGATFCLTAYLCLAASPAWSQTTGTSPQASTSTVDQGPSKADGNWKATLGAGVSYRPEYEGGDELAPSPIPLVDITWKDRVFLNTRQGLGAYAIRTDRFRLGGSLGYSMGRDEDDADALEGLGDIDPAAQVHLFGSYSFGMVRLHADLSQDLGGSDGLQFEPGATVIYPVSKSLTLSAGVSATWASDDYMQAYFGVSPAQSLSSGLDTYSAEAGFKRADLNIGATWAMNERWFTRANLGFGYLLGDAADSPITQDEFQPSVSLFVGYKF